MNEITRRDPVFGPMERLFGGMLREPIFTELATIDEGSLALDVADDGENIVVKASLPGYKREDVALEVNDGVLTISAKKDETREESSERFYRRERRSGSVSRRIALPTAVEQDDADAELIDGVLTLKLPKAASVRPRRIEIK
ncbi:MAG: Hsp20/alpha crystallin family protein [Phycisphaeraceae bacterium]|nr:MAG: Hsp20/alpha crystallin family protein [Phycisphaeraceae bacterium]